MPGPAGTHEYFEIFADHLPGAGLEFYYYDQLGIQNVYLGRYERSDGTLIEGASLSALTAAVDPELDAEMQGKLNQTMAALLVIKSRADEGEMAYDQMLGEDNEEGNATLQAVIDGLLELTVEKVAVCAAGESALDALHHFRILL